MPIRNIAVGVSVDMDEAVDPAALVATITDALTSTLGEIPGVTGVTINSTGG